MKADSSKLYAEEIKSFIFIQCKYTVRQRNLYTVSELIIGSIAHFSAAPYENSC
jgi:hypothetical protein